MRTDDAAYPATTDKHKLLLGEDRREWWPVGVQIGALVWPEENLLARCKGME
jgi:hypothetical protein